MGVAPTGGERPTPNARATEFDVRTPSEPSDRALQIRNANLSRNTSSRSSFEAAKTR